MKIAGVWSRRNRTERDYAKYSERRGRRIADNVIKGITIEIGGNVGPLNKALSGVNKESRSIQNELKAVEKLLKFDPSNTDLLAQKQKLLADAVNTAKTKLDALHQAQEEVNKKMTSGEIDKSSQEYRTFERQVIAAEQSLQSAQDAQDKFAKECDTAGKEAKEAGEESEKAGKKAKESGDAAKEGGSGWKKFGEFAKSAGKVAIAGVTAITVGATAAGKAVWDMAQDTADAGGAIDDAAKKVGTSAEEYQKWAYAANLGGMEVSKLDALMVKQQKTFADAQEGGKAASEAYKRLGIDISSIGNSGEAFNVVIDKLADMEDETTRNALANDIFGKSYADLAPLLAEGSAGIAAWKQECEDLGGVMSNEAVEAGAQFGDSLDRLKTTFSGIKNSIMGNMLPGLTQLTTGFTELLTGSKGAGDTIKAAVASMISNFNEIVPQFLIVIQVLIETIIGILPDVLTTLVTSIIGWVPSLLETVLQVLQSLILAITGNVQMIVNAVLQILTIVATFIIQNIPLIVNAALQIVVALIQGIAASIPSIIKAIVDMIPKLIQAITDNLPLIINSGITLILSLVQGLLGAIPQLLDALPTIIDALLNGILSAIPLLIDAGIQLLTSIVAALPDIINKIVEVLPQIITSIIDALMSNLPLIIQAGIDLLIALVKALPTIITTIVKAIPQIITSIINALVGNIDKIIMAGVQIFVALIQNLPTIIVEIVKAIPQIIKGIIDAIISFVPKMAECGLNLIKGLWNGIKDAGAWLWDKISGFFGGVVDKIKNFFGIHSPSTLFRDMIGKNLVKGIEVGVDVETPNLQNNLEKNLSAATKGLKATVEAEEMKLNAAGVSGGLAGVSLGGLHFEIGTFINNNEKDLQQLVEEGMEIAEEYMRRRGGVFA